MTAVNAATGKTVWHFETGQTWRASPMTYMVGGKQYVAVLVGSKQPISVIPNAPELKNTSTASMLYVFGL